MSKEQYNGWANYATWRVNLEMIDDLPRRQFGTPDRLDELAEAIEEYAQETIEDCTSKGIGRDFAYAFMSDVNWREIAEMFSDSHGFPYSASGDLIEDDDDE